MNIKEFAQELSGMDLNDWLRAKDKVRIAKENGWVIVTGASDDLIEFDGEFQDEGGCFGGGKVYFSKTAVYNGEDDKGAFPNCIEALWCVENVLDGNGNVIPWTYKTDIPHETFMVYEDGKPYCRGIVFTLNDLR